MMLVGLGEVPLQSSVTGSGPMGNRHAVKTGPEFLHVNRDRTELIIYGCLRTTLPLNTNIPNVICGVIEKYLTITKIWGKVDEFLEIIDDIRIKPTKELYRHWLNAFSYESFKDGVIRYNFLVKGSQFFVGIIPTDNIVENSKIALTHRDLKGSIAYWSHNGSIEIATERSKNHGETYGDNDVISVILNFESLKVTFLKNDTQQARVSIDGNTSYNFAVSVYQGFVEYEP